MRSFLLQSRFRHGFGMEVATLFQGSIHVLSQKVRLVLGPSKPIHKNHNPLRGWQWIHRAKVMGGFIKPPKNSGGAGKPSQTVDTFETVPSNRVPGLHPTVVL